jgi:hypothetical protein
VGPFSKVGQIKVPKWTKSEYRNQEFCKGEITDLSTSGAYVETFSPARRGSFIQLKFHVGSVIVEIPSMVVHQTRGIRGMGVCFRSLTPEQNMTIERVIHQANAGD